MQIKNIKINNYGKIKNKEILFSDDINVIYGENESGKSTLLHFILNSLYGISKNKKGKNILILKDINHGQEMIFQEK